MSKDDRENEIITLLGFGDVDLMMNTEKMISEDYEKMIESLLRSYKEQINPNKYKRNRPGRNDVKVSNGISVSGKLTKKEYEVIKEVASTNNFKFFQLLNPFIRLIIRYKEKLLNFKSYDELNEFVNRLALIEV